MLDRASLIRINLEKGINNTVCRTRGSARRYGACWLAFILMTEDEHGRHGRRSTSSWSPSVLVVCQVFSVRRHDDEHKQHKIKISNLSSAIYDAKVFDM